ncbi:MAG: hypothetical protein H7Y89_13875 [Steroidobacteraceae bacterium]|nr:hypothetical protein [Steroidobacteraceae bacterium]
MNIRIGLVSLALAASLPSDDAQAQGIDRHALVTRHNPTIARVDKTSPFMVGNGSLAFTADITGLQTFPEQYTDLVPLMTQSTWSWHSFPGNYTIESAHVPIPVHGKTQQFPYLTSWDEAKKPNVQWLRENPHRFSLGRLSLRLTGANGKRATFGDLSDTKQALDLWAGRLTSGFTFDGATVEVETSVHPTQDILIVRVKSALLTDGRLGVDLRFPGIAAKLNPDPADWANPDKHKTTIVTSGRGGFTLTREIDATRYNVRLAANRKLEIASAPHEFRMTAPRSNELTLLVEFSPQPPEELLPSPDDARAAVAKGWEDHWSKGGVVDFSGSTDPRARELERRVVLSQYLTAINGAGTVPPQEEGLFSNSWNGKFHLEMHAWHAAHFAVWGRPELLERSMPWYLGYLDAAKARATAHGVSGAWWPKMVGPEGRESPSTVNPFIMWQQPHPIYLAEVLYRARRDRETLVKYRDVVFETANLLASWPIYHPPKDGAKGRFVLGPPVIPAQENLATLETLNPMFEIEYFRFGLETAQAWRKRLGLRRDKNWDKVLAGLSKLPEKDGLYLAAESQPDLWDRARSAKCNQRAAPECPNRDHPSFVAALGLLPGADVDRAKMRRTLQAVLDHWDLRQTWGWDWPMLAMTAARLNEPALAVDFLLPREAKNFQFGVSGMTPRVHVLGDDAPHAAGSADGPGYRRAAETYFPSNGSLLLAVGLMASLDARFPGAAFPPGWKVRSEGILPPP